MQIQTKPKDAKKLISASMPMNISAEDKEAVEKFWNDQAEIRKQAIEKETATPTEPSKKYKYELWKYGKHWQAIFANGPRKVKLLPCPSLFSSAVDALIDKMEEAIRK